MYSPKHSLSVPLHAIDHVEHQLLKLASSATWSPGLLAALAHIVQQSFTVAGLDTEIIVDARMLKVMTDCCTTHIFFNIKGSIACCQQLQARLCAPESLLARDAQQLALGQIFSGASSISKKQSES